MSQFSEIRKRLSRRSSKRKYKRETPLKPEEVRKRKRERGLIVFLSILFISLTLTELRLSKISDSLPFATSIFFFGILNLNLFILTGLFWLIFRNLGKLLIERRRKVLGSRLKTKLVAAFLGFSIIPTLALFIISSAYINSSFDKWFSIKVQNTLKTSLEITRTYYLNVQKNATHFAGHIANKFEKKYTTYLKHKEISKFLTQQKNQLALDSLEYYSSPFNNRILSQSDYKENFSIEFPRLPFQSLNEAFNGKSTHIIQHIGKGDLIRCLSPVRRNKKVVGIIVVNTYIPVSLVNKVGKIANVFDDYQETNPLQAPIKSIYFIILIMITLVILFVAVWVGLFLAKELTDPVERLVVGAHEVGAGNLDVHIEGRGHDEISVLIDSFNSMIQDLRENRRQLIQTGGDLDRRKRQLEAVLANIGTGVLVVDSSGKISTFNRAASKLLKRKKNEMEGKPFQKVLQDDLKSISDVIQESLITMSEGEKQGVLKPSIIQWNHQYENELQSLTAIATPIREPSLKSGVVVVIDDMTHIVKSQREVAWREVARRIAHEIKNPLTPIKLSAQRLQRRLSHLSGKDAEITKECTETIVRQTDELKEMVNEFSQFARLPETALVRGSLNTIIQQAIQLFVQAHPQVIFELNLEQRLPEFDFDPDQIKRVITNLLDNAVAAVLEKKQKNGKIHIETHFNEKLKIAVLSIMDNGPGISKEVLSRLFEPYFSTKKEGTGLGLAIAKRIINDHDGYIRAQSENQEGTRFIIELPTTMKHISLEKKES